MSFYHCPSLSSLTENKDRNSMRFSSESVDCSKSGFANQPFSTQLFEQSPAPNIEHEHNVARSILQQGSSRTGNSLFDHLAEIIKLVIQKRPDNIVDYLEELSFNMREQKLKIPERFPWTYLEPADVERAKSAMKNLNNLHIQVTAKQYDVCAEYEKPIKETSKVPKAKHSVAKLFRKLSFNENVLRLHLYWTLCGFGLQDEEVYKLSYALQKVQFHPIVKHARFWGKMYGLKKSYYIVEVVLTKGEQNFRFEKMKKEMIDKSIAFQETKQQIEENEEDLKLVPGIRWNKHSKVELEKMMYPCKTIPRPSVEKVSFEIPPEAIGTGLNRRTYFVVNSLDDEWTELPIVTPKQVQISRDIKKYFTGDLEANFVSYPAFPGSEKYYLRAMIARITSGSYVAPNGYFRRLSKEEKLNDFEDVIRETEIDPEELESEEEELDNDDIIIENEEYKPFLQNLISPKSWCHVRPYVFEQGRVVHIDEENTIEAVEKPSSFEFRSTEVTEEDTKEEEDIFEEEDDNNIDMFRRPLFTKCNEDKNNEDIDPWTVRYSSTHNKINQLIIMRSNVWPGAYSFTFNKYSDSIYLGWGFKYTARNMINPQCPPIQDEYDENKLVELSDPTVKMEKEWTLFQEKKQIKEIFEEEAEEEEDSC